MRSICLLMLLVVGMLQFTACGYSDSDVLASYKTAEAVINVTRGEFYTSLNRWLKKRTLSGHAVQERSLRNFVFEKLLTREAKTHGLDKSDDFKKALQEKVNTRLALTSYLQVKHPRFVEYTKGNEIEVKPFSFEVRIVRHVVARVETKKTVKVRDPNRAKKMAAARKSIKDRKELAKRLQTLAKATVKKRVPLTAVELKAADAEALARVKEAQAELKSGKSFASVARRYGQDGTASRGGYFGFVYPHQQRLDIPFRDAALKLKAGETSGIVKGRFGYHLIKCDSIIALSEDNIEGYFPTAAEQAADAKRIAKMKKQLATLKGKQKEQHEKRIASTEKRMVADHKRKMARTLGMFWFSSVMQHLDKVKSSDANIKMHHNALKGDDPEAVIFEIKHPEYSFSLTLGEYLEKLKKVPPFRLAQYGIKRKPEEKRPFTYEERLKYFGWHISANLLTYSAYKTGVAHGPVFKKGVVRISERLLATKMREHVSRGLKVSAKERQEEFERNKSRYVKRKRVKDAEGKWTTKVTPLTFSQAKEKVEKTLLNQKKRAAVLGLKGRLFVKYAVKVYPDRFEIIKQKKKPGRRPRTVPQKQSVRPKKK